MLAENLKKMEPDGIIIRTVYPEIPPKVEYSLSGMGNSLRPITDAMSYGGNICIQENLI